jgi:DNA adenine methylase
MNKPFLKWAGNKYRVLPHLLPIIGTPKKYCEPFGGSMSTALNVNADEYILNDINKDLINLYGLLIDPEEDFISYCEQVFIPDNNIREQYNTFRQQFNDATDIKERARLFVYLNRHCFNGLTRYNSKGGFNVPFGQMKNPYCPSKEMEEFREYFLNKDYTMFNTSFDDERLYSGLGEGDVVYFDPPYVPASDTANFTDYATEGFNHKQQIKLVEIAESLVNNGIKVVISNHDVPVVRELYKNAKIHNIQVSRSIAAKGNSRKKANELIAVYQP